MGLLDSTLRQARAWNAANALASENDTDRRHAMQTLRDLQAASLPALRAALRRTGAPRAQFGASVVLHWLGDPAGMPVLLDALRWQIATTPEIARDLEAAFVAIGPPDAVDALMRVWQQTLPPKVHPASVHSAASKENKRVLATICRAWVKMGDPRPLALLADAAEQIPELFEEHVPRFQNHALPYLAPLIQDALPVRRSLAVRTLRHIAGEPTGTLLLPLLRDPDPAIRALTTLALDKMRRQGHVSHDLAQSGILRAVQAGFSTPQAVEVLIARRTPEAQEALLQLVLRWPHPSGGDTLDAVLAALPALHQMPLVTPSARAERCMQLCELLSRCEEPALLAGVARALARQGSGGRHADAYARKRLMPLLAHLDADTRSETANALAVFEDPLGRSLLSALEAAWPPVHWRDKLQNLLRGAPDAAQTANEVASKVYTEVAVKVASEAAQWFSRVSKGAVERREASASASPSNMPDMPDARLSGTLRLLLSNGLDEAVRSAPSGQAETTLYLCVACIRALTRLGSEVAHSAHAELLRALHLCPFGQARAFIRTASVPAELRLHDQAEGLRAAAGQALVTLYGADSFPLFLECLYATPTVVRATGIEFLGELADVRALPHLQMASGRADPLLKACLQTALARIRSQNPETMTLLRASAPLDTRADTLLRAASGNTGAESADILLRPLDKPIVRNTKSDRPL